MAWTQEISNSFSACISLIKTHLFQFVLEVTSKLVLSPSLNLFWNRNRFKTFCWNRYIFHRGM